MTDPLDGPDSPLDVPPLSPATGLRLSFDERHYRDCDRDFLSPAIVGLDESGDNKIIFERPRHREHTKMVRELNAKDCRAYCFKDCVIYDNRVGSEPSLNKSLLCYTIWREWFPHRDMVRDIADGSFFCKPVRFWPRRELADIVRFHSELCGRLLDLEPLIKRPKSPTYITPGISQEVPFRLRSTFPNVFIVIDEVDWKKEGVLVVCKDVTAALAYGADRLYSLSAMPESSGICFRLMLEEAVQFIVSQDTTRITTRNENSYLYHDLPSRVPGLE